MSEEVRKQVENICKHFVRGDVLLQALEIAAVMHMAEHQGEAKAS